MMRGQQNIKFFRHLKYSLAMQDVRTQKYLLRLNMPFIVTVIQTGMCLQNVENSLTSHLILKVLSCFSSSYTRSNKQRDRPTDMANLIHAFETFGASSARK